MFSDVYRFRSYAIAQILGFIIEYLIKKEDSAESEIIDRLLRLTGSKLYPLDNTEALRKGKISRKWKIINNAGHIEV